ncbi:hypothetical protein AAG570_008731 [Ranatra chinensis]|uniref:Uncharacterized protein n=1 Tax=Ranatra chinensis TaxID=642074 RepID=A0ABD0YRR6_9HEMI
MATFGKKIPTLSRELLFLDTSHASLPTTQAEETVGSGRAEVVRDLRQTGGSCGGQHLPSPPGGGSSTVELECDAMLGRAHTRRLLGIRRSSVLLTLYSIGYLLYLVAGATVFAALEAPEEKALKVALQESRRRFLDEYPCVSEGRVEIPEFCSEALIVHGDKGSKLWRNYRPAVGLNDAPFIELTRAISSPKSRSSANRHLPANISALVWGKSWLGLDRRPMRRLSLFC